MLQAALLVLALLARRGRSLRPAEEFVRAVRVEAEQPERLLPFVGLVPGRPLDREELRRAVELMFATGRFEDVAVELVRAEGQEGVEVVFRPRPAPLLAAVRIEGDRVIGGSSARRTARLRAGEPLWPARVERAARDVGLALAQRGHLEALVEPETAPARGGADLVLRIRAGPTRPRGPSRRPRRGARGPGASPATSCGPGPAKCTGASARSPRARRCAAASPPTGGGGPRWSCARPTTPAGASWTSSSRSRRVPG